MRHKHAICPHCGQDHVLTRAGVFRTHGPKEARCEGSGRKP